MEAQDSSVGPLREKGCCTPPPAEQALPVEDPDRAWNIIKENQIFAPVQEKNGVHDRSSCMRIVCVSDTHGKHRCIPVPNHTDVLVHGGDFTNTGEPDTVEDLGIFFGELVNRGSVKHIVCIAGNHELTFEPNHYDAIWPDFHPKGPLDSERARNGLTNCVYLEDQACTLMDVKFFGSPWQPEFFDWAFNMKRSEINDKWAMVPDETDVLVTHGPPLGRGDNCANGSRAGCVDLLKQVQFRIKPRVHIFGHIHEGFGVTSDGKTLFVNASSVNIHHRPFNPCIVIDLPYNKDMPAVLVQPECSMSSEQVVEWAKCNSYDEWVPILMSASPSVEGGEFISNEISIEELLLRCSFHREMKRTTTNRLQQARMQLRAESYG